jgi:hypothetical protein
MSYKTQFAITQDSNLTNRTIACAAMEKIPDPATWVYRNQWQLSAQPGWGQAYASAIANGIKEPGNDEGAITDGMILAAVQLLNVPPTPEGMD